MPDAVREIGLISPVNAATAEHYVWGVACDGWRLLCAEDLSVTLERVPAGRGELRHFHTRARQFFFILTGRADIEVGEKVICLQKGQGLHVPPGVEHRFANVSQADVVFLVISAPPSSDDRTDVTADRLG